jgi:hypothetical protein
LTSRDEIDVALKNDFVPALRAAGFRGSLPHFRRLRPDAIDLLTVQFDRLGGGFVMEIARCGVEGFTTHWGKPIPPSEVTAHDLHPDQRHRIKAATGSGTDSWFRYEGVGPSEAVAAAVAKLPEAEAWWQGTPNKSLERTREG